MDLNETGLAITNLMKEFGLLSNSEKVITSSSDSEYEDEQILKRLKGDLLPKTLQKTYKCPYCNYFGKTLNRVYNHILNHKSIKEDIILRNEEFNDKSQGLRIISIYRRKGRKRLTVDIVALIDLTEESNERQLSFQEYENLFTPKYDRKNMIRCQNCRGIFTSYSQLQFHNFHCRAANKNSLIKK